MAEETITPGTGDGQATDAPAAPETGTTDQTGEGQIAPAATDGQGDGSTVIPENAPSPELRSWATRTAQENSELRRRLEAVESRVPAPKEEISVDEMPPELRENWSRMKPEEQKAISGWNNYFKKQAQKAAQEIVFPFIAKQEVDQARKAIPDFEKYQPQILAVADKLRGSRLMPSEVLQYAATIVKGEAVKGEAHQAALKSLQQRKTASSLETGSTPSSSSAGVKRPSTREAFEAAVQKHGGIKI